MKEKKRFFKNIDSSENRFSLWNICKPYLSNKGASSEKIILVDDEKIITDDKKLLISLILISVTLQNT